MKYTNQPIPTTWGWSNKRFTIPKGLPVRPATNLPQGGYWVITNVSWEPDLQSWSDTYGFHVTEEQVA